MYRTSFQYTYVRKLSALFHAANDANDLAIGKKIRFQSGLDKRTEAVAKYELLCFHCV